MNIALEPGEKIILEVHKNLSFIFAEAIAMLFVGILPVVIFLVLATILPQQFVGIGNFLGGQDRLVSLAIFLSAAWLELVVIIFFIEWTNFYLDVLIITDRRIFDIEQFILFSRDEVTIPLSNVQDIKVQTFGIFATLLDYGNLQIQTAGAARETIIRGINNPEKIKELIDQLRLKFVKPSSPN